MSKAPIGRVVTVFGRCTSEIRQQPDLSIEQTPLRDGFRVDSNRSRTARYVQQDSGVSTAERSGRQPDDKEITSLHMPLRKLNKLSMTIGFFGLGLMGSRLTRRLHAAGWNIRVWNRSSQPATQLKKEGIVTAQSLASLVAGSDVILSSLAHDG